MTFDTQKLDAELRRRGAELECPVCDRRAWSSGATHVVVAAVQVEKPGTTFLDPTHGVAAACLVCKNCGFVRLHELGVLGIDVQTQ